MSIQFWVRRCQSMSHEEIKFCKSGNTNFLLKITWGFIKPFPTPASFDAMNNSVLEQRRHAEDESEYFRRVVRCQMCLKAKLEHHVRCSRKAIESVLAKPLFTVHLVQQKHPWKALSLQHDIYLSRRQMAIRVEEEGEPFPGNPRMLEE